MLMIEAAASGVVYTTSPDGNADSLIITAAWGLGESVVEGMTGADVYTVQKGKAPELIQATVAKKESLISRGQSGGTIEQPVPPDRMEQTCLPHPSR